MRALLTVALVVLLITLGLALTSGTPERAAVPQTAPPAAPTPTPIRIVKVYSSLPLTGALRPQSLSMVNAIRMAFDETGGREGTGAVVGALTVDYESLDNTTPTRSLPDPVQEAVNAARAADDPQTVGYLGPFGASAARVSLPVLSRAGIVMIAPATTASDLTLDRTRDTVNYPTGKRSFFRVIAPDDAQGTLAAAWMKDLKVTKVFVVDDGGAYGNGIASAFAVAAARGGINVLGRLSASRPADFDAVVARVKATDAEAVYYAGVIESDPTTLIRRLRAQDPRLIVVGSDGIFDDGLATQLGAAGESVYATVIGAPVDRYTGAQADWSARFRAKYGADPQPYAIYAYESARVMLAAIRAAEGDRARMIDAVKRVGTGYDGVLGTWSFDASGDVSTPVVSGMVVQQGKWIYSRTLK